MREGERESRIGPASVRFLPTRASSLLSLSAANLFFEFALDLFVSDVVQSLLELHSCFATLQSRVDAPLDETMTTVGASGAAASVESRGIDAAAALIQIIVVALVVE